MLSFWWDCLCSYYLLYKDEAFVTFVTNIWFQVILCFLILLTVFVLHRMNNIYLVNLYQYSPHLEMLLRHSTVGWIYLCFLYLFINTSLFIFIQFFFMMWRDIIQLYTQLSNFLHSSCWPVLVFPWLSCCLCQYNNLWGLGIYSRVLYLTYHGRLNVTTNSLTCLPSASWLYFASPLIPTKWGWAE